MPNIFVNWLNFEFEESASYHDILVSSGSGNQSIDEQRVTVAHIYVNQINIEVPAAELIFTEFVTCAQTSTQALSEAEAGQETCSEHGTQTIEEVIIGTPVPEPEPAIGGGVSSTMEVLGGRPWAEEDIYVSSTATQLIGEEIFVGDILEIYANNVPDIDTRIRRPVYAKPRAIEIMSFTPTKERTRIIPVEAPLEEPKINHRKKEEEELLLLGII